VKWQIETLPSMKIEKLYGKWGSGEGQGK